VIEDQGFTMINITLKGSVLQILAEDPNTKNLGVDDCAALSREISAVMDVEDPISGRYQLEVSSPGIDRPLTQHEDFEIYQGFVAKVEMNMPIDGQKKFRGTLKGFDPNNKDLILLETDHGEIALAFSQLHKAKLVLTDELIKTTKRHSKQNDTNSTEEE
jgi:ribosome maturation factor RimP